MLDAYIIDRIRREREPQQDGRVPLHIHIPEPEPVRPRSEERDQSERDRGVEIVDYRL